MRTKVGNTAILHDCGPAVQLRMIFPEVRAHLKIANNCIAFALLKQFLRQGHVWPKAIELRRTRCLAGLDQLFSGFCKVT